MLGYVMLFHVYTFFINAKSPLQFYALILQIIQIVLNVLQFFGDLVSWDVVWFDLSKDNMMTQNFLNTKQNCVPVGLLEAGELTVGDLTMGDIISFKPFSAEVSFS